MTPELWLIAYFGAGLIILRCAGCLDNPDRRSWPFIIGTFGALVIMLPLVGYGVGRALYRRVSRS